MEDGRIYMVLFDINDEEGCPIEPDCVRMKCPIGGFLITPDKNDPNKCMMDMIIEGDTCGLIPDFVLKILIK